MNIVRIQSMWGLGDNIYLRPIVQSYANTSVVYTDTPWPELYQDIPNVRFYLSRRPLRTQIKNINRQHRSIWSMPPNKVNQFLKPQYTFAGGTTLFSGLLKSMQFDNLFLNLNLPTFPRREGKIALIRPVTIRREWLNSARNPLPEYVNEIASLLVQSGYHVICVADIDNINECIVGEMPMAHEHHLSGLPVPELLGMVQSASVIVGGPGWIIPAAIAANVPALIIFGGQGAHNSPDVLVEKHWRHKLQFMLPDNFHQCSDMRCLKCDKIIKNFPEKARDWLTALQKGN